jgi:hypothetical protein
MLMGGGEVVSAFFFTLCSAMGEAKLYVGPRWPHLRGSPTAAAFPIRACECRDLEWTARGKTSEKKHRAPAEGRFGPNLQRRLGLGSERGGHLLKYWNRRCRRILLFRGDVLVLFVLSTSRFLQCMVQAISNQHVGRLRLVETTTNAY